MRSGRLAWPVLLIVAGLVALAINLGYLNGAALWRLASLWPLILILIGVEIVVSRLLPPVGARAVGLLALLSILTGALAYAATPGWLSAPAGSLDTSASSAGLGEATLELDAAAATVTLQTAATGGRLYEAHVDYPAGAQRPTVSFDRSTGLVRVTGQQGGWGPFGPAGRETVRVTLDPAVAWTVTLNGAAVDGRVDLGRGRLAGVHLTGAGSSFRFRLPRPSGKVRIRVAGAGLNAEFAVPAGVEADVHSSGAASSVNAFGTSLAGFGDQSWASPGYASAADGYDFQVSGAAAGVGLSRS